MRFYDIVRGPEAFYLANIIPGQYYLKDISQRASCFFFTVLMQMGLYKY